MSVKVMSAVWELQLTPPHLIVLLALADHADDEGRNAYPSIARLAWKTGYSESQVRRILKQLAKSGVVERSERPGHTPIYTVRTSKGTRKEAYSRAKSEGLQNDTPTIAMTPHPYHSYDTPTPTIAMTPESSVETSVNREGDTRTPARTRKRKTEKANAAQETKERVKENAYYKAYHDAAFPPSPVTLGNAVECMDAIEALQDSGVTPEQVREYVSKQVNVPKFLWLPDRVAQIAKCGAPPAAQPVASPVAIAKRKAALELLELQNAAAAKEGVA